jgi:hypothetical protein
MLATAFYVKNAIEMTPLLFGIRKDFVAEEPVAAHYCAEVNDG